MRATILLMRSTGKRRDGLYARNIRRRPRPIEGGFARLRLIQGVRDIIDRESVLNRADDIQSGTSGLPQWCAGIVNHGSYDDVLRNLASLARQSHPPNRVAVYDTGVDLDRFESLRGAHPRVLFDGGENLGYAGGANRVIERIVDGNEAAEFCLVLNPDVELDPQFAERLIEAMLARPNAAIASGKLLRPGRDRIDSAGIDFPRNGRPRDRASDELDRGQFDRSEFVDGASGAALMLRIAALPDLEIEGEFFDETFFAYHEDTDLCWRARRLGWKILYHPTAVAIHSRGWRKQRRHDIPAPIRRHSFKNHYLQLVKNETVTGALKNLPWLLGWEVLRLGFVLLRDRAMIRAYREAWVELPHALRKRRLIAERARKHRSDASERST